MDNDKIKDYDKYTSITGLFDSHTDAPVWYTAHRPTEYIQGFTRSHWMPPLGTYLRGNPPAAAMVINLGVKHKY